MAAHTINVQQLALLVDEGAVSKAVVSATPGGFAIQVNERLLEARRGNIRRFKKLDTVAAFLREYGIGRFEVDVSRWTPEQKALI
jgi:hypothetical protein